MWGLVTDDKADKGTVTFVCTESEKPEKPSFETLGNCAPSFAVPSIKCVERLGKQVLRSLGRIRGTSAGATDQNSRVLIFCRIVWLFRQSFYVKDKETSRNDESQMVKRFGFFGVGMSDFLCILSTTSRVSVVSLGKFSFGQLFKQGFNFCYFGPKFCMAVCNVPVGWIVWHGLECFPYPDIAFHVRDKSFID